MSLMRQNIFFKYLNFTKKRNMFRILFILVLISSTVVGQDSLSLKKGYKYNNNFDLAFATSSNQSLIALSWTKMHKVFKKGRFKIGYGLRFNAQFGKNLNYYTAPAELTSKQTGPQVLFSKTYTENIDTFYVTSTQNNSCNINIHLQYTIKQKIDIGFNIDAIGLSFGKGVTGKYISNQAVNNNSIQTAKPTPFNGLLVSDNDIGSLNSELYLRYWIKPKWAVRVGASFLFTEYTTTNKLRLDNDRWRNKSLMGLVAVTFSPFR